MGYGHGAHAQVVVANAASTSQQTEEELAGLLAYLNPPQQQYGLLADGAAHLLSRLPPGPSPERALAAFFQLFARGYAIWQSSYHYHAIHEYFYGAYLQALDEGGNALPPLLGDMLFNFSQAMIAYTWCENAIISNNPWRLWEAAQRAHDGATAARDLWRRVGAATLMGPAVDTYLQTNMALFRGLKLCAEVYLFPERRLHEDPTWEASIHEALALLQANSHELFSELRAHYTFATRYSRALTHDASRLRVDHADIVLRAIGYVGEDLITALFDRDRTAATAEQNEHLVRAARAATALPIKAIRKSVLQDLFETSLGEAYLDQIVFDLEAGSGQLSFVAYDGQRERAYAFSSVQVRAARFGSISVEFALTAEDISVSHLRVLESLIAPHAGRFTYVWTNGPTRASRATTDYVEAFLAVQAWLARVRAMSDAPSSSVALLEEALHQWQRALADLSRCLRNGTPTLDVHDVSEDHTPQAQAVRALYAALQGCVERMRACVQSWMADPANQVLAQHADLVAQAKRLFPAGDTFGYLTDIAEEVFERIARFLTSLLPKHSSTQQGAFVRATDVTPDLRLARVATFDSNTGWQAIISCSQVSVTTPGQPPAASWADPDIGRIRAHRDFKGLIIQNREARASLDDWLFVATPSFTNVATIRSHETDLMVVGENRALLYLEDDPQYLVAQYVASAAIVGDIRTIVLAYNMAAKTQLMQVEAALHSIQVRQSQGLGASRTQLLAQRERIEVFRTNADQILDLIRSYTISKYQDHSELLRAMVHDSGVESFCTSLQRNIETLDHFHAYVTELIQRKIERRNQSNQGLITWLLLILSFVSGLSAIDPIASFLTTIVDPAYRHAIDVVLFAVVTLTVCAGGILIGLRSRDL